MTSPDSLASLDDWLTWIPALSSNEIELGLDRVAAVYERLGSPRPGRVLTVAGTNGKGSSVRMLEALLLARGERLGAYTSPHILRYEERIRINGKPADARRIVDAFRRIEAARQDVSLTYFEFGTLAALVVFGESGVDSAVLEVGLGGRLDAVNIVDHDGCIITNVSLDHMEWLGDSVGEIAREKAGVMRKGRPVVYGASPVPAEIVEEAEDRGAHLIVPGRDFRWEGDAGTWRWIGRKIEIEALKPLALHGMHQRDNAAAALALLEAIGVDDLLAAASVNESLADLRVGGRQQSLVRRDRHWLLDGAHNEEGARALGETLKSMAEGRRVILVLGILDDKDVRSIAAQLTPLASRVLTLTPDSDRAIPASRLKAIIEENCRVPVVAADAPDGAFESALEHAGSNDLIVVAGSFYTLALAYRWFGDTVD